MKDGDAYGKGYWLSSTDKAGYDAAIKAIRKYGSLQAAWKKTRRKLLDSPPPVP